MKRFLIIPLLLCLLVSISSCTKVPNLEKIESVYISIKDIVYRDVIYKEVQVTIDNEQLFEIVRDFHESLEDYEGKKGINLAPWEAKIEYVFKDGSQASFGYCKSGNDEDLFGKFLDLCDREEALIKFYS